MAYSKKVIDHFKNPKNIGSLDKDSSNVGTGLVGAPECGDVIFKTFGCGSAIAASSLATEWVKDRSVEDALTLNNVEIVEELSLPPVKIHCSVLAEDAIKAAIADYKEKQAT